MDFSHLRRSQLLHSVIHGYLLAAGAGGRPELADLLYYFVLTSFKALSKPMNVPKSAECISNINEIFTIRTKSKGYAMASRTMHYFVMCRNYNGICCGLMQ